MELNHDLPVCHSAKESKDCKDLRVRGQKYRLELLVQEIFRRSGDVIAGIIYKIMSNDDLDLR